MDRILDYLSDYTTGLSYDMIPADAVEKTKGLIVDTLGCALGGYDSFPSQVAVDLAKSVTSTHPATVLVSGNPTTPDLAALRQRSDDSVPGLQRRVHQHRLRPSQ